MSIRSALFLTSLTAATLVSGCASETDDTETSTSAFTEGSAYGPKLACPSGDVSGDASLVVSGRSYATDLRAGIYVRNTTFRKRVGVILSTDDFRTPPQVIEAHYVSTGYVAGGLTFGCGPGFELWGIDQRLAGAGSAFSGLHAKVAFFYDDLEKGQSFYDSNFGANYDLSVR